MMKIASGGSLSLQDIKGSKRLVIYVGIDGSSPLLCLFDMYSSAFNPEYSRDI